MCKSHFEYLVHPFFFVKILIVKMVFSTALSVKVKTMYVISTGANSQCIGNLKWAVQCSVASANPYYTTNYQLLPCLRAQYLPKCSCKNPCKKIQQDPPLPEQTSWPWESNLKEMCTQSGKQEDARRLLISPRIINAFQSWLDKTLLSFTFSEHQVYLQKIRTSYLTFWW